MRVISGCARGTKLKTISGMDLVRPTADKVKGAMFNMIQFSVAQADVLDLFCGSGALGIEALSRGAAHATFVDGSLRSLRVTEDNLKQTHLSHMATLIRANWEAFFRDCRKRYSIVFADPPYAMQVLPELLSFCSSVIALGGFLVYECARETPAAEHDAFVLYRHSFYGSTGVMIYQRRETL